MESKALGFTTSLATCVAAQAPLRGGGAPGRPHRRRGCDFGASRARGASSQPTLLDNYEYAMHGKVFQYDHKDNTDVFVAMGPARRQGAADVAWPPRSIYVSFGGLLMCLQGDQSNFVGISVDQDLYCLIKKTADALGT